MNSGMSVNNAPNFGASYHTYFYTTDGRRIVSEQNMKKCYMAQRKMISILVDKKQMEL